MSNWLKLGTLIVTLLPKFIGLIEKVQGAGNGADKKAAVKDLIVTTVGTVDVAAGKTLLDDAEVAKAYDDVNDAIVAFQNIVAKKAAVPSAPAAVPPATT